MGLSLFGGKGKGSMDEVQVPEAELPSTPITKIPAPDVFTHCDRHDYYIANCRACRTKQYGDNYVQPATSVITGDSDSITDTLLTVAAVEAVESIFDSSPSSSDSGSSFDSGGSTDTSSSSDSSFSSDFSDGGSSGGGGSSGDY